MSRVYFHSPHGKAELAGSERAWLTHVGAGPSVAAWDLRSPGSPAWDRAYDLLDMSPEPPAGEYGANYLHEQMRAAKAADEDYRRACERWNSAGMPGGLLAGHPQFDPDPGHALIRSLETALRVNGLPLQVAGHALRTADVDMNTAVVAGSDVVALAAKLGSLAGQHLWVDGPDRGWLADLMDEGLQVGIFRRTMRYASTPSGPLDKVAVQGWEQVQALLRARDDGPVVTSDSSDEHFPNPGIAAAEPDAWYELSDELQWATAMRGLRLQRPWARLAPDTLREPVFGPVPLTVYDLLAPDRDDRVRRAFADTDTDSEETVS